MPGFTRVSAVIVIEQEVREKYPPPDPFALADEETVHRIWPVWERARELSRSSDNEAWMDHRVLVAHNPNARHVLAPELFHGYVQFTDLGTWYGWNDGARL